MAKYVVPMEEASYRVVTGGTKAAGKPSANDVARGSWPKTMVGPGPKLVAGAPAGGMKRGAMRTGSVRVISSSASAKTLWESEKPTSVACGVTAGEIGRASCRERV